MTDRNVPPPSSPRGGSGVLMAFIIGGLVVAVAVIAWVLLSQGTPRPETPSLAVDMDLTLPDAPRLPDGPPAVPPVEPPSVPSPSPAPAN